MKRLALSLLFLASLASLALSARPAPAAESIDELLNTVPADANVLMVVRVQDVLKSPKAVQE